MDDFENENSRAANIRFFVAMALITVLIFAWGPLTRWMSGDSAKPPEKPADKTETKTADGKTADGKPPELKGADGGAKPPEGGKPAEKGALAVRKPAGKAEGPVRLGAAGDPGVTDGLSAEKFFYQAVLDPGTASLRWLYLSDFSDRVESTIDLTGREPRPMPLMSPAGTAEAPAESFQIVRLTVDGKPVALGPADWQFDSRSTAENGNESVTFKMIVDRPGAEPLTVLKTFTAVPRKQPEPGAGYLMTVSVAFRFPDKAAHKVGFDYLGPVGVPEENAHDVRRVAWGRRSDGARETRRNFLGYDELATRFKENKPVTIPEKVDPERGEVAANIWYAGILDRFFAVLVIPDRLIGQAEGKTPAPSDWESIRVRDFPIPVDPVSGKLDSHSYTPEFRVAADVTGTWERSWSVYAGPKTGETLTGVGEHLKADLQLGNLIDYAQFGCCPTSWGCNDYIGSLIGKPLLHLMDLIYMVIPNYGIAIIIMVLMVRALVYPISRKGTLSMLRMKELQPKLAEIQAKYADDKQTLGQKQMELYQKEGINPLGGCLPNLIQMPIWVGLWGALSAAVNLRHAPFVGWIHDLAGEDALIQLGTRYYIPVPLCGQIFLPTTLNLLPLATAVVMFINQKMMMPSSSSNNSEADQANPMNSKMMTYMFSGMFLMMLYSAPAGLNLYIMTSMLFGILESRWVKAHYEELKAKGLLTPKEGKPGLFGRLMERVRKMQEDQEKLQSGKADKSDKGDKGDQGGGSAGGSGGGQGGGGNQGGGGGKRKKKR